MSVLEPSSDEPTMRPDALVSAGPDWSVTSNAPPSTRSQEVRTVEARELDLGEVEIAAVGVVADDAAAIADRNRLQLAGGETVLLDLVDLHVAVGVSELRQAAGAEVEWTSPSVTPFTVGAVSVTATTGGVIWPLGPKVKSVFTFCQATCAPVAVANDLIEQVPLSKCPPPSEVEYRPWPSGIAGSLASLRHRTLSRRRRRSTRRGTSAGLADHLAGAGRAAAAARLAGRRWKAESVERTCVGGGDGQVRDRAGVQRDRAGRRDRRRDAGDGFVWRW